MVIMIYSHHYDSVFILIVNQIFQVFGSPELVSERSNISVTGFVAVNQFKHIIDDAILEELGKSFSYAEKHLKSQTHHLDLKHFSFLQILYGLISGEESHTKLYAQYGPRLKEEDISHLKLLNSKLEFNADDLGIALHNYVEWNMEGFSEGFNVFSSLLASIASNYSVATSISLKNDTKTLSWLLKFKPIVENLHPAVFHNSWNSGNSEIVSIILQNGGITTPGISKIVENLSKNSKFIKILVKNEIVDSIVHLMSKNLFDLVEVITSIIDENKIGLIRTFFPSNLTDSDEVALKRILNMPFIEGDVTLLFKAIEDKNVYAKNIFLKAGADVNALHNCNKSLLHLAVEHYKIDVARELIELGAEINTNDCKGLSPLHKAISSKKVDILKLLLDNTYNNEGTNLLYNYLEGNNTELADIVLKAGVDIDSRFSCNETLLHKAVAQNKLYVVNYLIKNGANMYSKECRSLTSMHLAIQFGNWNAIKTLALNGFDVNTMFEDGRTPLSFAAANASMEVISKLVALGAKVDLDRMNSTTPLFEALRRNRTEVVQYFLNIGGNINIKLQNGDTYLHRAVQIGSPHLLEDLIRRGVFIDSTNAYNETALAKSIEKNRHLLINVLAKNGANLTQLLPNGETYLHLAVHNRAVEALQALLLQGISADGKLSTGDTPMWLAVKKDDVKALSVLKASGADINKRNRWKYTLFHEAAYSNSLKALAWLAENGLSVNVTDTTTKSTALHLAAYIGSLRAVQVLLAHNPCINCKDINGCTPLFVAKYYHHTEIAELIESAGGTI